MMTTHLIYCNLYRVPTLTKLVSFNKTNSNSPLSIINQVSQLININLCPKEKQRVKLLDNLLRSKALAKQANIN